MGTLFDGIDGKEGSFAAIHCNKGVCYQLARAAGGGYQAIEEIAAIRLREFATKWDGAVDAEGRRQAIQGLLNDSFHLRHTNEDQVADPEAEAVEGALRDLGPGLSEGSGAAAAVRLLLLSRKHPRWKLFRGELWRDAERAATEVAAGRADSMMTAVANVRRRISVSGRRLPKRTVSTPLLLKGLEFDHVVIPDASAFERESQAQAKLFYVAISRATRSLTIASPERWLRFPVPRT
jgi:DNA helicase-2/ATP-dependent DNA helicase PcrA